MLEKQVTTLRGRPQCFKTIRADVDQETHHAILEMANEEGRPMTEVVRDLIERGRAAKEGIPCLEFKAVVPSMAMLWAPDER